MVRPRLLINQIFKNAYCLVLFKVLKYFNVDKGKALLILNETLELKL